MTFTGGPNSRDAFDPFFLRTAANFARPCGPTKTTIVNAITGTATLLHPANVGTTPAFPSPEGRMPSCFCPSGDREVQMLENTIGLERHRGMAVGLLLSAMPRPTRCQQSQQIVRFSKSPDALTIAGFHPWSNEDPFGDDTALEKAGDPCRARTCDNLLRRQVLYPAELRGRLVEAVASGNSQASINASRAACG